MKIYNFRSLCYAVVCELIESHVFFAHEDPECKTDIAAERVQLGNTMVRKKKCYVFSFVRYMYETDPSMVPKHECISDRILQHCSVNICTYADDQGLAAFIHVRHSKQHGTFLKSL